MTRHFLDVSAVRIQAWLSRSSTLAGRRGASAALASATSAEAVAGVLAGFPGARINEDAGQVDGVIHVELTDPGLAEPVARACLAFLRERLPAVELTAVTGSGRSYLDAYAGQIKTRLREQRVWRDVPAVADFPPVMTCSRCRVGVAVRSGRRDPGEDEDPRGLAVRVCADCAVREDRQVSRSAAGGAELELAGLLGGKVSYARTFEELAGTPLAIDVERSAWRSVPGPHLATVYADGNGVGALMEALAQDPQPDRHARLAATIDEANLMGLAQMVDRLWARDVTSQLPIIPHVVAGDDLLVSVPAVAGWEFAVGYAESYTRDLAREAVPGAPRASVSAGIVFTHASHPFAEVADLAARLLKKAKADVCGREASLSWLDVTTDGRTPPKGRPSVRVTDLTAGGDLDRSLRDLAALPASQRATLEALSAQGDPEALARQIQRLGLQAEAGLFFDPGEQSGGLGLADAVNLTRWYVRAAEVAR